jgi:general secretion pathway protein E
MIQMPHGIILVTGPTGSGKTTTLYSALNEINSPEKKIITLEDPVEYHLKGINQIPVKPKIGLTFATGLRSIVRQDPDVIMIGEMRITRRPRSRFSPLSPAISFSALHGDAPRHHELVAWESSPPCPPRSKASSPRGREGDLPDCREK